MPKVRKQLEKRLNHTVNYVDNGALSGPIPRRSTRLRKTMEVNALSDISNTPNLNENSSSNSSVKKQMASAVSTTEPIACSPQATAEIIDLTESLTTDGPGLNVTFSPVPEPKSIKSKKSKAIVTVITPSHLKPPRISSTPIVRKPVAQIMPLAKGVVVFQGKEQCEPIQRSTTKPSNSVKKTNIPNFSAIHNAMFSKMESIDDTVKRRKDRHDALSARKENKGRMQKSNAGAKEEKPRKVVRKLNVNSAVPEATIVPVYAPQRNDKANDIVQSRLERRQNMYKSRTDPRDVRGKRNQMLRGVRLNRRFELQMQFREQRE